MLDNYFLAYAKLLRLVENSSLINFTFLVLNNYSSLYEATKTKNRYY